MNSPPYHSPLQIVLWGTCEMVAILFIGWIGTRYRRGDFSFGRVFGLTVLCLGSSLPFAFFLYSRWPLDWESSAVKFAILLAVISPWVIACVLALVLKSSRKNH